MSLLIDNHSSEQHRRIAYLIMALLTALTLLVVIEPTAPWPEVTPFLPMYAMTVILLEGITGYLLIVQFVTSRVWFIGVTATAYLFLMPMVTVQLLVFPGVFSEQGLLNAHSQSAVWIWVFWHAGFPLLILTALAIEKWQQGRLVKTEHIRFWVYFLVFAPLLTGLSIAAIAVRYGESMPTLIESGSYQQLLYSPYALLVWLLNLLAVVWLFIRGRHGFVIHVWLMVSLFASLIDVTLTLFAGARYSAGWYAARVFSAVSAGALLTMFLWEINRLYLQSQKDNQDLYDQSVHDALTGLFNRRYFEQQFAMEMARSKRQNYPLTLMMLDIDHFKNFNDEYGHQLGDRCLQAVATCMKTQLPREGDTLARFGGEEFIILLPATDAAGGRKVAERLRAAIGEMRLPTGAKDLQVTVSIGVVSSQDVQSLQSFLKQADMALYEAKAAGRNQVMMAV